MRSATACNGATTKSRLGLLALFVVMMAVHLWSLMRFPLPSEDEAWLGSRAWAFLHTGHPFGPLDAGVFDRFEGYWIFFPWLPSWLQSLSLHACAVPALLPLRLLSLGFGLVLLSAIYAIAHRLGGRRLGFLSVLLVSLSPAFLVASHSARLDIMTATLGFLAVALCLNSQSAPVLLNALSGLCVGLAFEVHPYGALYGPTVLSLLWMTSHGSCLHRRSVWGFAGGVVIGLIFYAVMHLVRYPHTYFTLARIAFGPTHMPPILHPGLLLKEIREMSDMLINLYGIPILVVLWAVFHLLRSYSRSAKILLTLIGSLIVGFTLLVRNKLLFYTILLSPAIDLIVAAWLVGLVQQYAPSTSQGAKRRAQRIRHNLLRGAVCGGLIVLYLCPLTRPLSAWWIFAVQEDARVSYQRVQQKLHAVIQPQDSIMASQTFWFGLHEHSYYSWEQLVFYRRYAPGSTLNQALQAFHPDLFIIDDHMRIFISDSGGTHPYSLYLRLPQTELEQFLAHRAQRIAVFDDPAYGAISVWRINWNRQQDKLI